MARRALVLPADQVAPERFYDAMDILLRPIPVRQQVFDAVPSGVAVILAVLSFIEEFAVMDAHIFLILTAILDFHRLHSPPLALDLQGAGTTRAPCSITKRWQC